MGTYAVGSGERRPAEGLGAREVETAQAGPSLDNADCDGAWRDGYGVCAWGTVAGASRVELGGLRARIVDSAGAQRVDANPRTPC